MENYCDECKCECSYSSERDDYEEQRRKRHRRHCIFATIGILLFLGFCYFLWWGRPTELSNEKELVKVVITDTYHKNRFVSMVPSGKTIIPITHSEENVVYFSYQDKILSVDNKDVYAYCKDSIGEELRCMIRKRTYDTLPEKADFLTVYLGERAIVINE